MRSVRGDIAGSERDLNEPFGLMFNTIGDGEEPLWGSFGFREKSPENVAESHFQGTNSSRDKVKPELVFLKTPTPTRDCKDLENPQPGYLMRPNEKYKSPNEIF